MMAGVNKPNMTSKNDEKVATTNTHIKAVDEAYPLVRKIKAIASAGSSRLYYSIIEPGTFDQTNTTYLYNLINDTVQLLDLIDEISNSAVKVLEE